MASKAKTATEYLKELPEERRKVVEAIRGAILKNLDKGFEETMQYGMLSYAIPHSIYPAGYHCDPKQPLPLICLGNQKNYVTLHMFCIYMDPKLLEWFQAEWKKTGKKLDMGKGCVRFKKLEDIPLDLIGRTIKKIKLKGFLSQYESLIASRKRKSR